VEANNSLVVLLAHNNFHVALTVISEFVELPLERLELLVVGPNIIGTVDLLGIVFRETAASILEGCEYSDRNIDVVHEFSTTGKQSVGEESSCLDCDWGQLKLSFENITDGVYILDIGLFLLVDLELAVLFRNDTGILETDGLCDGVSSNGEKNSVVLLDNLLISLAESDMNLSISFWLLELYWRGFLNELGAMSLHEFSNSFGHVLIEASKED
jgi:hypothetical protein